MTISRLTVFPGMVMRKDRGDVTDRVTLSFRFEEATADELAVVTKAAGGSLPDGYLAGWASTDAEDSYGHIVMPGAFAESIARRGLTGPRGIKYLIAHSWEKPGGAIKVLEYRGGRLWIEVQMELGISYVRDAYLAAKAAGGFSFSVGFFLQDYEFKENDAGGENLIVNRGDLFEVSSVVFPANEECGMEFVKTAPHGAPAAPEGPANSMSDFERALVKRGLVKSRSDAHRVVEAFKESAHLFKWGAPSPAPKSAPFVDPIQLDRLNEQIAALEKLIAPAAK